LEDKLAGLKDQKHKARLKKTTKPKVKRKKNEYTLATRIVLLDAKLHSLRFTIPVALAMVTRIKEGMKGQSYP